MARGNLEQHSPNILLAVPIFWDNKLVSKYFFFHLFSIIKLQNFLPFWSPEKVCVNANQDKYMPISVKCKILLNVQQKKNLRLPSSQPLYMRGKVTFRKCNKCQVCLYPSWTSNERPSFASTFSVGHPKAHRRASIQTNYHSSLFLFVRCEKKNRTMRCFSIKIKGN